MGESPVIGADVRALVRGPDTEVEIVFKDTGTGYPDIRKGDGIYSGYLPTFSSIPGYYTLRILASDNNGQAFTFTDGAPIPTGSFKRILSAPSFHVGAGAEKGRDVAPPSKVTDLQLVNSTGLSLTLTWSAAGGDYDIGRSARVELRCHTSHVALSQLNFTKQGILVPFPEDVHPLTHGLLQTINARIPWTNEVFYYGLVSYDEAGNMAEVSNLVEVFIEEITTKSEEANLTLADLQLNLGESSWLLDKTKIYIIGGVVAGVILVIVLLVTCLIVRAKRLARAKTRWVQDTYEAGFSPEVRVEKVETESGIYSWLESLPRSEKKEEEGSSSSSSRPTTSTDDSISDSGDHIQHPLHQILQQTDLRHGHSQPPPQPGFYPAHSSEDLRQEAPYTDRLPVAAQEEEELSHDAYARQLLQRSRFYYSMRAEPPGRPPAVCSPPTTVAAFGGRDQPDGGQQIRKKRHESVV